MFLSASSNEQILFIDRELFSIRTPYSSASKKIFNFGLLDNLKILIPKMRFNRSDCTLLTTKSYKFQVVINFFNKFFY